MEEVEDRLRDAEREKESLRRQLDLQTQHLPGVGFDHLLHKQIMNRLN